MAAFFHIRSRHAICLSHLIRIDYILIYEIKESHFINIKQGIFPRADLEKQTCSVFCYLQKSLRYVLLLLALSQIRNVSHVLQNTIAKNSASASMISILFKINSYLYIFIMCQEAKTLECREKNPYSYFRPECKT